MKTLIRNISPQWLALLAAFSLVFAQAGAQAQGAYAFSQQELDQMLAPIALYPDPLLSQILMAATYPSGVAEAARWSRDRPGLSGDDAVRAAEGEDWDASVKSLLAFPQVLERMDENPQWTQTLGDAFLGQQAQLMDTVQSLRRRAAAAGNLRSDDRLRVIDSGSGLMVEPLDPRIVYVPYYDPLVAYGPWWWPAYPPVCLRPWPGYFPRPGYAGAVYWGPPVGVSAGFFFGAFDWTRRRVQLAPVNNDYYTRHSTTVSRVGNGYSGHSNQPRYTPPAARPEPRAAARSDGRRPERWPAVPTRANPLPAPAARPAPVAQAAPATARFDHRRESLVPAQPAYRAPVTRPTPAILPAPPAPVMRAAPAARYTPAGSNAPVMHGNHQAARAEAGARHEAPRPGR